MIESESGQKGIDQSTITISESLVPKGLNPELLLEIVRRIVETIAPEKIILFGSAARGEIGPNSDLDLMVVKANVHRRKTAQILYGALQKIPMAMDIVVQTPEDLEKHKETIGYIIRPALKEGKIIYAA